MKKIIILFALVAVSAFLISGCQKQDHILVGNDTDAHGCKGSAGYSWCELKQKCLRTFEEPCQENVSVKNSTQSNLPSLTPDEVLAIAKKSACVNQSNLIGRPLYEEKTRKWWISMDGVREGCKAICAVYEETGTAKLEWRCDGPLSLL